MVRGLALLLTVFTGFSGLVYEVAWQRYLATLLGSHSEATAAVLGIFLAGLSAGYSWFGRVTRRELARARARGGEPRLLLVYAGVEAGIGLWALAFPWLFSALQALSTAVPHGVAGAGFAFDVGLAVLLIGPPTLLMGGTIPILTQALARSIDDATRFHAFVYAFNTAGAFAGALLAGFALVPGLGLVRVLYAMAAINLAAGALFAWLGRRGGRVAALDGGPAAARIEGWSSYAAAALLTGFAMMVLQTVLIRLAGLSFGSSEFTFATVVSVFVLCIALGSFAVSALRRIPRGLLVANQWALFALLLALYGFADQGPYWVHVLRTRFGSSDADFHPYYLSGFAALLAVIGPPVALSGAALPLLFHQLRRQVADLGAVAGRLYSWNTLGSLLGALLGGYALLFWLELDEVYRVALAALALAAALLVRRVHGAPRAAVACLGGALACLALLPAWKGEYLSSQLFRVKTSQPFSELGPAAAAEWRHRGLRLVFHADDPIATVAVLESGPGGGRVNRALLVNGKSEGDVIGDYATMALAALLPALMAERAERAFVIGYGTGITAGELAQLASMREVVVAEISPGVLEAAPWFDFANFGASRDAKIATVRSDAYRALLRSPGGWDVIASEPSNPWVTGVEMLFSREFLAAARDRLAPGGVYAQWFHQYETDTASVELVLRTYASVFERVSVWYSYDSDLLLLGFRERARPDDLERLGERARAPDFAAGLARCGITDFAGLLAHELLPLGVVHAARFEGPVQTLLHPRLAHMAGRAFFRGGQGELPFTGAGEAGRVGAANSLVQRSGLGPGARQALLEETCEHRRALCVAMLAEVARFDPAAAQRFLASAAQPGRVIAGVSAENPQAVAATLARIAGQLAPLLPGDGPVAPEDLGKAVHQYRKYYHHAVPFDPALLRRAAARCDGAPGCAEAASRVEALLHGPG